MGSDWTKPFFLNTQINNESTFKSQVQTPWLQLICEGGSSTFTIFDNLRPLMAELIRTEMYRYDKMIEIATL